MISVELFKSEKHYADICNWWTAHKWPSVPLTHLPQTGIVVSHSGKLAAATWIYKTDSALCWIEWIVANPEIRHEARAAALSTLISSAKMVAVLMGFKTIFMSIKSEGLAARIKGHGFNPTDQGMTNYSCDLTFGGQ